MAASCFKADGGIASADIVPHIVLAVQCHAGTSCSGNQHRQWSVCLKTGGEGANAAIDPIGGKMTGQLVKSLAKGGKYMLYGALAQGEPCQVGKAVAKAW